MFHRIRYQIFNLRTFTAPSKSIVIVITRLYFVSSLQLINTIILDLNMFNHLQINTQEMIMTFVNSVRRFSDKIFIPYWIRIDIWQGSIIIHEWSWNFTTLIWTIFPGCSWFLIALWQELHVFWWPKISATSKTMKNHEIPSTQFNVMSFREVLQKLMKVEGIHPRIPWNFPGSSWCDWLG